MKPSADQPDIPAVSLADIEVVFADSRAALEAAWSVGLSHDVEIRSSSPGLLMDPDLTVRASDEQFSPERLGQFYAEVIAWAKELYEEMASDSNLAAEALVTARVISRFQTQIYKIMALEEGDFYCPVTVLTFDVTSLLQRRILTSPLARILRTTPGFHEIRLPKSVVKFDTPLLPTPSVRERLRVASWAAKMYRLALTFWDHVPLSSPRGTVLVFGENSLIKETAYEFIKRGFGVRLLNAEALDPQPPVSATAQARRAWLTPKLSAKFSGWMAPSAVAPSVEYLLSEIEICVSQFDSALIDWKSQLRGIASQKPRLLMVNLVGTPQAAALCVAAKETGLPVVCFQHGVARELGLVGDRDEIWFETLSADVFFTHTEESARITNVSTLGDGRAIPVGLEQEYHRAGSSKPTDLSAPPIWYISTMLHIGNLQMVNRGMRDLDQTNFELRIIDDVLARVPHRVLHKPYPTSRYPDVDPVLERARKAANIEVYDEAGDLRYMVPNAKVLVTARNSSTVAMCVMSGKPVVYISVPGRPLSDAARAAMEKGIFVFDGGNSDGFDALREFLSQPIAEIEAQWRDRSSAREKLINDFFDIGGGHGGARAAKIIRQSGFDPRHMEA